jgi:competence protein ComEA
MKNKTFDIVVISLTVLMICVTAVYLIVRSNSGGEITVDTQDVSPASVSESASPPSAEPENSPDSGDPYSGPTVNINEAGESELEELPGIGPVLARRIVEYRAENGNFETIYNILNVEGIGEKKFADIEEYICVLN